MVFNDETLKRFAPGFRALSMPALIFLEERSRLPTSPLVESMVLGS